MNANTDNSKHLLLSEILRGEDVVGLAARYRRLNFSQRSSVNGEVIDLFASYVDGLKTTGDVTNKPIGRDASYNILLFIEQIADSGILLNLRFRDRIGKLARYVALWAGQQKPGYRPHQVVSLVLRIGFAADVHEVWAVAERLLTHQDLGLLVIEAMSKKWQAEQ
ncbi:MAG: hypothetical protein WCG99_01760 [Candidatus Berkelbacteria bacterium]